MCDYYGCNKPYRPTKGSARIIDCTGEVWGRYCPMHAPVKFEDIFKGRIGYALDRLEILRKVDG